MIAQTLASNSLWKGFSLRRTIWAGYNPLVYITDQGNGALNPNIYLTFTYKGEDYDSTKTLYTSYPQLYKIRKTFAQIRSLIETGEAFVESEGTPVVKYTDPFVLANIGKQNKWISFKLVTIENTENGVSTVIPAVTVEMSDTNQHASVLTVEEFLTVATIIEDLDLASIQCQMSLAYLSIDQMAAPQRPAYNPQYQQAYVPQQQGYYQQQNQYRPQQQQYTSQNQYQQPRQSQGNYTNNRQQYQTQPRQNTFRGSESQGVASPYSNPGQSYTSTQQSGTSQMTNRGEKSVMNFKSVAETPVSEVSYDDSADIDAIFDENN